MTFRDLDLTGVIIMESLSAPSRIRPAVVVCGGAAAVVAGAWLGPVATTVTTASPASANAVTSANVSLVAWVTPLAPQDGPGGGPGGSGSDPGDGVAPSPGGHKASESSSGSGGSGSRMTLRGDDHTESMFQKVGHWLGLGNDAKPSSAGAPAIAKHAEKAAQSAEHDPADGGPKTVKPGNGGDGGAKTAAKESSGPNVGGIMHDVFSGVGRFVKGIFGV